MAAALVRGEFERSVIDEGNRIRERFKLLLKQASRLRLNKGVPPRSLQRLDAPFVAKESDVVGRDGDKKKIIELLLSADTGRKNLSVIPIVGMGGIGKTTLAQLVYKDSRVQKHFDLRAWVTISEDFDVFQITKRIYEEVTSQKCKTKELYVLQSKLNEALAGKRFFFVLDDVWNENYLRWESLESGFQTGTDGNTIIVTTRSEVVASTMSNVAMHELKLVSIDDCWQIFANHVFVVNQATTELQKIGLEIVKRCKGLPLAVKSVAGLLRSTSNPEEWRRILNSDIWKLQFRENLKNDIVPAIWLSYHFLPPVLKRCFAYCSIFPKDYEFMESDKEKIILLWMAEGLLTPEHGERMEDVGKAYLQALISRSFFQQSNSRWGVMVMHDLVHDLAMFISGEFCFSCGDSNDLSKLGTKSYHLSYRKKIDDLMKLGAVSQSREKKLMSLRTLLALPLSFENVFDLRDSVNLSNGRYFGDLMTLRVVSPSREKKLMRLRALLALSRSFGDVFGKRALELLELFLKVGGCLRVLSLSPSTITELPDSIGNMKYLRYLGLSGTSIKELPDSICTLYNLQTLLLSQCHGIAQLPNRLAGLVNLRHLDITNTPLKELPNSICTLYNLQTLLLSGCYNLAQLPTRLAGLVNLRHLDISETPLKELPDSICTLYNLQTLLLSICYQLAQLPTRLAALVNLRHLDISGTPLKEMPPQMCEMKSLQRLSDFVLGQNDGRRIKELGGLPLLEGSLCISGLQYIVDVKDVLEANLKDKKFLSKLILQGNWWDPSDITSSQQEREVLEALQPHKNLKELTISGYSGQIFPNLFPEEGLLPTTLTNLTIEYCKKLNGIALRHLTSLRSLSIVECRELECLPQEGLPLSLSSLTIIGCPGLEQRCQRGRGEDWPKIQHIPKIHIE